MQNILKKYQAVFCVCRLNYNGHFLYYQKAVLCPFKGVLTCNYSLLLKNKSLALTDILINHKKRKKI